jgi:hypothetical protein
VVRRITAPDSTGGDQDVAGGRSAAVTLDNASQLGELCPAMVDPAFAKGTRRAVLCIGPIAFKIARADVGARCNLYEAELYRRARPYRRAFLCPVLWCSTGGAALVMRRARPMTECEFAAMWNAGRFPDWNVFPPDDEEPCSPLEPSARNWGWLDGVAVAIDYSANVE